MAFLLFHTFILENVSSLYTFDRVPDVSALFVFFLSLIEGLEGIFKSNFYYKTVSRA